MIASFVNESKSKDKVIATQKVQTQVLKKRIQKKIGEEKVILTNYKIIMAENKSLCKERDRLQEINDNMVKIESSMMRWKRTSVGRV